MVNRNGLESGISDYREGYLFLNKSWGQRMAEVYLAFFIDGRLPEMLADVNVKRKLIEWHSLVIWKPK